MFVDYILKHSADALLQVTVPVGAYPFPLPRRHISSDERVRPPRRAPEKLEGAASDKEEELHRRLKHAGEGGRGPQNYKM